MGRQKKKNKPPPKRKLIQPLPVQFSCPFCNHEKTCDVKMDKSHCTARISCYIWMEDFQTSVNYLYQPIDVYNDWVDACEAANKN